MSELAGKSVEQRAADLFKVGYCRGAIDVLEAHLSEHPEAGASWRLRAVFLLYREGRVDEAFHDVQRALALVPLGAEAWIALAEGYFRSGQRRSAADVLAPLAADSELAEELWLPLFNNLFAVGMWQAALAVSRRAAERRPDDDVAFFSMAHAALRARQPRGQAIHLIERAIALNPLETRYRVTLAVQLLRIGRRREAHQCVAALRVEEIESLACRCCLEKFLRLTIDRGDAERAALLAGRLARLASGAAAQRDSAEDAS